MSCLEGEAKLASKDEPTKDGTEEENALQIPCNRLLLRKSHAGKVLHADAVCRRQSRFPNDRPNERGQRMVVAFETSNGYCFS